MEKTLFAESERLCETLPPSPRRICFVCTGNTCRSPMAQAVANDLAGAAKDSLPSVFRNAVMPAFEAYSAGLYANDGEPIATNAVMALENAAVSPTLAHDYHTHRAHTLTEQEAETYDLLVGMTSAHAMELLMRFPHLAQRITRMPQEISDPFGGDLACYQTCLSQITDGVKALLAAGEKQ